MLTNNISKAIFMGNGIATEFPFKFKVWNASQLIVTVVDPNGIESPAVGWSVVLSESGGTITYLHEGAPLPSDYKLVILRNMPFTQGVDLITGTRFDPQVIEDALDRATAERQQLQEAAERSLKISPTAEFSADELLAQIFTAQVESANSAHMASESALSAQENSEQSSLNAQSAAESAKAAQNSAENAAQDVSEALELVEAEGTKQLTLIQQEGEEQRANVIQTINSDPTQASADKVPSEVAVSEEFAKRVAYIIDYYPKTAAEKASANGHWWRKWSDGLIEQGGRIYATETNHVRTIQLLKNYSNSNYDCIVNDCGRMGTATETADNFVYAGAIWSQTSSNFRTIIRLSSPSYPGTVTWSARGY